MVGGCVHASVLGGEKEGVSVYRCSCMWGVCFTVPTENLPQEKLFFCLFVCCCCFLIKASCNRVALPSSLPRIGELRTQKLKSHLLRTRSLMVLPLKHGIGQYIAGHATLTARNFFLANFYPSGPFICIFSKTSPEFFL